MSTDCFGRHFIVIKMVEILPCSDFFKDIVVELNGWDGHSTVNLIDTCGGITEEQVQLSDIIDDLEPEMKRT